jgi:hypothetical protein
MSERAGGQGPGPAGLKGYFANLATYPGGAPSVMPSTAPRSRSGTHQLVTSRVRFLLVLVVSAGGTS